MGFILGLIKWTFLAPFKVIKFIVADIIVIGIIGGTFSLIKTIIKILFKPLSIAAVAGGVIVFLFSDEEKRNKIKAFVGM
jgi:hypothetical protein